MRIAFATISFLAITLLFLVPLSAGAVSWWPIVPCGLNEPSADTPADQRLNSSFYQPCTKCDLFRLVKNLMDLMTYVIVPVVGTAFIVWAGFKILISGASAASYKDALGIIRNTLIGIAIVWGSWLIANTVVRILAADSNVADSWYEFQCKEDAFLSPTETPAPTLNPTPGSTPTPSSTVSSSPAPSSTATPVISALTITTPSLSDARQDFEYKQTIQATGGIKPYNWSLVGFPPAGLQINGSTGEIFGRPTASGISLLIVRIQDSSSPIKEVTKQLTLKIVPASTGVTISNVAATSITANGAVITWTTDKPANSVLEYGPTTSYGATIGTTSAQTTSHRVTITGLTPGTTYNYRAVSSVFDYTARSSNYSLRTSGGASTTVSPSRTPTPSPLSITTSSLPGGTVNTSYSQSVTATGGTQPYSFSILSGGPLPPDLSLGLGVASRTISGTLTTAGTYNFTIKVEDSSSPKKSATKQLSIVVGTQAASIIISNVRTGIIDSVSATIGWSTDKPSTSQVESGRTTSYDAITAVNSAMVLNHSMALTNLTPNTTYNYRVISTIPGFTAKSSNYTFTTTGSSTIITTSSLPSGTLNQNYSQQLTATGGATPYSWSKISGTLPSGLSLNSANGSITGIPTTAGTSTFTVKVTDNSTPPKSAEKQLSIVVAGTGTSALSITTSSLAGAKANETYSQTLTAAGGKTPYFWSLSQGILPPGLQLSPAGQISGKPTSPGVLTFTIKVEDSSVPKLTITKQLSISVTGILGAQTCPGKLYTGTNLCQARQMNCSASTCSQYVPAINQYAGGAASANLLKAIMIKESACRVGVQSNSNPPSCGLMQLKPSTANIYRNRCGIESAVNITCDWLKSPANASASICIAAEYVRALAQTSCGSSTRNLAAGYNGGSGACNQSQDCNGQTSCDGSPVKRWECLYDNPEHTVCNEGYDETRDYATKVLYCYNNPGF